MFRHGFLGFCAWDVPAFIVFVIIVVIFILHRRKMKKREEELEDELSELQECKAEEDAANKGDEKQTNPIT